MQDRCLPISAHPEAASLRYQIVVFELGLRYAGFANFACVALTKRRELPLRGMLRTKNVSRIRHRAGFNNIQTGRLTGRSQVCWSYSGSHSVYGNSDCGGTASRGDVNGGEVSRGSGPGLPPTDSSKARLLISFRYMLSGHAIGALCFSRGAVNEPKR
jgi:hypothetical protein